MIENNDDEQQKKCAQCRCKLAYGEEVISVQEAVIGPRGLVPLDEPLLFCSEDCLSEHLGGGEVTSLPRRIP